VARVNGDKVAAPVASPALTPASKTHANPPTGSASKATAKTADAAKPASADVAAAKPVMFASPAIKAPTAKAAASTHTAMKVASDAPQAAPQGGASAPAAAAETPAAGPAVAAPVSRPPAPPAPPPGQSDRRPGPADRIPPRPPSKAEIFIEGDYVVYPTHGVGKVERIAIEEIAGHRLELIHITFEENRMTLRVPVAKARSAGLRKLATRKLFDEAMAVLKGRARIKRTMWSRRAQEYEAKINSGDPLAIAEVVRDLHRNAGQPDQSFSERQIYEAAMDRLAAELAALDKTDKPTAVTKLGDFLKTV